MDTNDWWWKVCDFPIPDDEDVVFIKIPQHLQLDHLGNLIAFMVSAIYPNIERTHLDPNHFIEKAIVT
jgi:hypothetical protein